MSPKASKYYICRECGDGSASWLGKCPGCGGWNTLEPISVNETTTAGGKRKAASKLRAKPYTELPTEDLSKTKTGLAEFDRVLGGGIVAGSVVLLGGEPGVGKSTILLQISERIAQLGIKVLYVSGEESESQIQFRGLRLGISSDNIFFLAETMVEEILEQIDLLKPKVIIIDSIQTMRSEKFDGGPGSITQIRAITAALLEVAKYSNVTVFLTGHVTKEGLIAGPKSIEHIVDIVLYFEGERNYQHRIIRTTKNRFGPAGEIGIFEMRREGLVPVEDPSSLFVNSTALNNPGSVVFPSKDGSRAFLVEVQALVSSRGYAAPRRTVVGVDYNRTMLVLAVLEKRLGLEIGGRDIFISLAGGVFVNEPSIDLPIAAAVISSHREKAVKERTAIFGELGLTGEIKGVAGFDARIKEAVSHGFNRFIIPAIGKRKIESFKNSDIIQVNSLSEMTEHLF